MILLFGKLQLFYFLVYLLSSIVHLSEMVLFNIAPESIDNVLEGFRL